MPERPTSATGRYASMDFAHALVGALCALNLIAALKFLLTPGESSVAHYPLLGALAFATYPLLGFLRRGTLELDGEVLRGRRRLGGAFELRLEDVRRVELKLDDERARTRSISARYGMRPLALTWFTSTLELFAADGRRLAKLRRVSPGFAGLVYLVHRYRTQLSAPALAAFLRDPVPSDVRAVPPVVRYLHEGGKRAWQDRGHALPSALGRVYLPATPTAKASPGGELQLLLPVSVHTFLLPQGVPSAHQLPLVGLARAILGAEPPEKTRTLLAELSAAFGGSVHKGEATAQGLGRTAELVG